MNEKRFAEIETKLAFQEDTINDLSDTVYRQQKQIDELHETIRHMMQEMTDGSSASPGRNLKDEKPPHY